MDLRSYLSESGLSQADFGRSIDLSQAQVSRIVNGATPPSDLAVRINRATGGRVLIADLIPSVFEAVRDEIARAAESERSAVA